MPDMKLDELFAGRVLSPSLWDSVVDEFLVKINSRNTDDKIILIIQKAKKRIQTDNVY